MPLGQQAGWMVSALAVALVAGCASGPEAASSRPPGVNSVASGATAAPTVAPVAWQEPVQLPGVAGQSAEAIPSPPQEMIQPLALLLFYAGEMGLPQNPDLLARRAAQGGEE